MLQRKIAQMLSVINKQRAKDYGSMKEFSTLATGRWLHER